MISQDDFEAIGQKIKLMSNKQLATLNFLCWAEATDRAAVQTEKEIEQLVDNALKSK